LIRTKNHTGTGFAGNRGSENKSKGVLKWTDSLAGGV
jgi:hypothetical protein